jgi:hypothetical protein
MTGTVAFECLTLLACTLVLHAQQQARAVVEQDVVMHVGPGPMGPLPAVKGEPYSAEAITETTRALPDGNQIRHQVSSRQFRDSQGRTRSETAMPSPAGWTADTAFVHIAIFDPVAGVHYALNPHTLTVRKFGLPKAGAGEFNMQLHPPAAAAPDTMFWVEEDPSPGPGTQVFFERRIVSTAGRSENIRTESLGRRFIEGVQADGTRTIETIPAGQMGNDRPIEVTHEAWHSPDLQVIVMSRHSDPRFGETVYRLTGVQRAEPDPALFQVPAGYTFAEAGEPVRLRLEQKQ